MKNSNFKLNLEKAREIRKLYDSGNDLNHLAFLYGVTYASVRNIIAGLVWNEDIHTKIKNREDKKDVIDEMIRSGKRRKNSRI